MTGYLQFNRKVNTRTAWPPIPQILNPASPPVMAALETLE